MNNPVYIDADGDLAGTVTDAAKVLLNSDAINFSIVTNDISYRAMTIHLPNGAGQFASQACTTRLRKISESVKQFSQAE